MDRLAFAALLLLTRATFDGALGAARGARMRVSARTEFAKVLPQIPAASPAGARPFYLAACYLVAVHRALPERTAGDNSALVMDALRRLAGWLPGPLVRARRWLWFQPWYNRRLANSIVGPGPEDFAGGYVTGEAGRSFGVDYHRCGLQIFLAKVGAPEIGPLICGFDQLESELFGLGLVRTGTIAGGAKTCDFRWTRPD